METNGDLNGGSGLLVEPRERKKGEVINFAMLMVMRRRRRCDDDNGEAQWHPFGECRPLVEPRKWRKGEVIDDQQLWSIMMIKIMMMILIVMMIWYKR